MQGLRSEPHSFHPNQQEKKEHIVRDEEGVQQVRGRKKTRKNIFDRESKLGRRNATNLGEEAEANQNQGQRSPT